MSSSAVLIMVSSFACSLGKAVKDMSNPLIKIRTKNSESIVNIHPLCLFHSSLIPLHERPQSHYPALEIQEFIHKGDGTTIQLVFFVLCLQSRFYFWLIAQQHMSMEQNNKIKAYILKVCYENSL